MFAVKNAANEIKWEPKKHELRNRHLLDLPTHFFFGIAIALISFGKPAIVLLVGIGALLTDLDKEYW